MQKQENSLPGQHVFCGPYKPHAPEDVRAERAPEGRISLTPAPSPPARRISKAAYPFQPHVDAIPVNIAAHVPCGMCDIRLQRGRCLEADTGEHGYRSDEEDSFHRTAGPMFAGTGPGSRIVLKFICHIAVLFAE